MYEVRFGSNAGETIYYPAGGAMRVSGTLKFILSDQLGSTSVMTSDSGVEQGRMGYYPFGKTRYSSPVERTGQAVIYPPIDSTQGSS